VIIDHYLWWIGDSRPVRILILIICYTFSNILSALHYSCIWIELDIFQRWIGDCRSVRILILIFCYTSQRYRLYLILVFESSWDIFQRWIGDYRPVRILILIFCYTSQINRRFLILIFESSWTFFRDRDSMLYKLIWSRFLGSVKAFMGLLGQTVLVGVRVLWWARHRFWPYPREFGFYFKMNPAAGEIVLVNAGNLLEIYSKIKKLPCLWSAMYKDPFPCLVLPLGCSHLNVFIDRTQFCLHVISWPLEKA
jgi:hypothetical protein